MLALSSCAIALPQFGGGSAGGLLGHHQPLHHYTIGLSGGFEEESGHGKHEGGEESHKEEEHKEGSIGFTGSDFKTPVDVHHEEEVHLKVSYQIFILIIWKSP